MILDVYVMDKSGICLCRRTYKKIGDIEGMDSLLLTGFMSAVMSFTENLASAKLEVIRTDKYVLLCNLSDPLATIILADKEDEDILKEVAEEILKRFKEKYRNKLENWDKNVDHFQQFCKEIDQIVQSKAKYPEKVRELILSGKLNAKEAADLILAEINQMVKEIMKKDKGVNVHSDFTSQPASFKISFLILGNSSLIIRIILSTCFLSPGRRRINM
nr:hypothetical protein [Candidatus Freyrarchaeum guaymaensis]